MVEMQHTRTFNKIRTSHAILQAVRDWAKGKDLSIEDESIIKVIGSKAQIDELAARVKPLEEAEKAAAEASAEKPAEAPKAEA